MNFRFEFIGISKHAKWKCSLIHFLFFIFFFLLFCIVECRQCILSPVAKELLMMMKNEHELGSLSFSFSVCMVVARHVSLPSLNIYDVYELGWKTYWYKIHTHKPKLPSRKCTDKTNQDKRKKNNPKRKLELKLKPNLLHHPWTLNNNNDRNLPLTQGVPNNKFHHLGWAIVINYISL